MLTVHLSILLALTVSHGYSSTQTFESAEVDRVTSKVNAYIRGLRRTMAYRSGRMNIFGCRRRRMNFLRSIAEWPLSTKEQELHHNLCVARGTTIYAAEAIE